MASTKPLPIYFYGRVTEPHFKEKVMPIVQAYLERIAPAFKRTFPLSVVAGMVTEGIVRNRDWSGSLFIVDPKAAVEARMALGDSCIIIPFDSNNSLSSVKKLSDSIRQLGANSAVADLFEQGFPHQDIPKEAQLIIEDKDRDLRIKDALKHGDQAKAARIRAGW